MTERYFDWEGKPITLWEWAALMESGQDRHVADDMVGDIHVSTVWLGLNHNWGPGPPLIFETMVFGGAHDEDCWRYPSQASALAGHDQAVTMVREAQEIMNDMRYYLDTQKGTDG